MAKIGLTLDKTQWKHIATLIDRTSLGLVGWAGYSAWTSDDFFRLVLILLAFAAAQSVVLAIIKEQRNDES